MAQTDLDSDCFCAYNLSADPFNYITAPFQYQNTFCLGEVGVSCAENPIRQDVINIDSYLSGRDDILTKCNPPMPDMDSIQQPPLTYQSEDPNFLIPNYTREKRSANDLDAVSYDRWEYLPINPQDITHIISTTEAQRGGADTQNITKQAWNTSECNRFLDPQRYNQNIIGEKTCSNTSVSPVTYGNISKNLKPCPYQPKSPEALVTNTLARNVCAAGDTSQQCTDCVTGKFTCSACSKNPFLKYNNKTHTWS